MDLGIASWICRTEGISSPTQLLAVHISAAGDKLRYSQWTNSSYQETQWESLEWSNMAVACASRSKVEVPPPPTQPASARSAALRSWRFFQFLDEVVGFPRGIPIFDVEKCGNPKEPPSPSPIDIPKPY